MADTRAIAEDGLIVHVPRGENADRTLSHDGVTRQLRQLGARIDQVTALGTIRVSDRATASAHSRR